MSPFSFLSFSYILIVWLAAITCANGQIIRFVSTTGINTDPAAAQTWATSTTNLQGAIDASLPGDQVWVARGIYKPTALTNPASRTMSFSMKGGVAIYGGFIGNETNFSQRPGVTPQLGQYSSSTLSGDIGQSNDASDNSYHVIYNSAGLTNSAILDGFIITAGNANGSSITSYGGGMYNYGVNPGVCSPTLRNCLFVDNHAEYGGGLYNNAGPATLNGNGGTCSPTLTNCAFLRNAAGKRGGAIYGVSLNREATSNPTFTQCLFQENSASEGGAVYSISDFYGTASPTFIACVFEANSAGTGGAIKTDAGYKAISSPVLINCSFMLNTAQDGGAFYNLAVQGTGSPQFTNCSFQSNQGVLYNNAYLSTVNPVLTNCVLFRNGAAKTFTNLYGATIQFDHSLVDNTATGYTSVSSLTTVSSPFLNSISTFLSPCSPAINTGLNSASGLSGISTDLAGNSRIQQNQVDMGAYEAEASSAVRSTRLYVNASATGTRSGLDWTNAFTDLQAALFYPCVTETLEIWVAGGLYKPTATTSRDVSFALRTNVTVYGGFTGQETELHERPAIDLSQPLSTTLSGDIGRAGDPADNSYHVVSNTTGLTASAVLDGFVITGGNADDNVINGTRVGGGGLYNESNGGSCSPTIRNCAFIDNSASFGGAIYNGGQNNGVTNTALINCLFRNNKASSAGGAIFNSGYKGMANPIITNCTFSSNTATNGGAMYNNGDSGVSSPLLTNCSFYGNKATTGGIIYSSGYQGASNTTLTNCIAVNSAVTGVNGFYAIFGSSIAARYSLFGGQVEGYVSGPGNLTATALPFADATTLQLTPDSPAINTGDPASTTLLTGPYSSTGVPITDLAGQPRIVGLRIDMGAYEYQAAVNMVRSAQNGLWNDPTTWSCACVPTANQQLLINHTVTLPPAYEATCQRVEYGTNGRVTLNPTSKLRLSL